MFRLASMGQSGKEQPVWIDPDRNRYLPVPRESWRIVLEEDSYENLRQEAEGMPEAHWTPLAGERIGPPIPNPSKVIAIGLNYRDHAEEQGKKPPERPLLFAKAPSCLIGTGEPIRIPQQEHQVDAEAELCLVIGKRTCRVEPGGAAGRIFGYTVFNDVSGREAQYGDRQWFRGKSYDTFGPCGPWIVPAEEVDPHALRIRAFWNDQLMQEGHTSNLIHNTYELVSYISHQMTLLPGDLIATGTPSGVGVFRDPQIFLQPGDRVRIEIESIGAIENHVEAGS